VILLATASSVVTADSPTKVVSTADAQTIDGLFAEYNRPSVPGAAVAVIDHGRLVFIRTYGLANLETKTRVTERTNFRLAHEGIHSDGRNGVDPGRPADDRHARRRHHP